MERMVMFAKLLRRGLLLILMTGMALPLLAGGKDVSVVVGRGGDKIELKGSGRHDLFLRISGGRVKLEQFMAKPLRSRSGEVKDLLRCWVRFQGPSTGRIDWVNGELVSRSPKIVFSSSGLEGTESRLILEYERDESCSGEYEGVLGLVVYSQDDPSNRKFVTIPVKITCSSGINLLKISSGKELLIESDKTAYIILDGSGPITLMKDRRLPELEFRIVRGDKKGDWMSLDHSAEVVLDGEAKIEFKPSHRARAGEKDGMISLRAEDGQTVNLLTRVKVLPKVEFSVDKSSIDVRVDPKKLESSIGVIMISVYSNIPDKVSLVQEVNNKFLLGPGNSSVPIDSFQFCVQKQVGENWETIVPWKKVGLSSVALKMAKDEFFAKIRILYRIQVKDISKVPAGEYQLPVRLSVVVD